jgi:hypothetical protein
MANNFPGSGLAYADQFAVGRSSGTGLLNTFLSNDPTTNQVRIETDNSSVLTYIGISAGTMEYYRGANTSGTLNFKTKVASASSANGGGAIVFSPNGTASDYTPVERMRILMNGNVGIGTDVPSYKLDVSGTNGTYLRVAETNGAGGYGAGIRISSSTSEFGLVNADNLFSLYDYTNGARRLSITSAGNVIIGGTTAQNNAASRGNLTINGTTSILNLSISDTNGGYLYHGGTDMLLVNAKNGAQLFYTNDTERMRITSAGNIGIGGTPTNFGAGYTVLAIDNAGAGGGAIDLMAATVRKMTIAVDSDGPKFETKVDGDPIKFKTNSGGTIAERVRITSSGSVGINTSTPGTYKLNVNGTFYSAGSSLEYKTEISTFDADTNKILELRPVTYQYKDEYKHLGKELKSGTQIGLIAEEVAEVFPELAMMKEDEDGETRVRNVDYEKLSILLLSEVQKLRKEVNELKNK